MNAEELKRILKLHQKWLNDEPDGVRANLFWVDLSGADLREADLREANLFGTDLSEANLFGTNLSGADLREADLFEANLSGSTGLPTVRGWMAEHFEKNEDGWIVFKAIGGETPYDPPQTWKIEPGAYLEEVVDPLPTNDCGCGVNFGTREWIEAEYPNTPIWKCLIEWEDAGDIVVPYHTTGKARCGRLKLLEIMK